MDSPPGISIPAKFWLEMAAEAALHQPEEACGLLAGMENKVERHYCVPNELHSPTRFRMQAQDQVRALLDIERHSLELLAIWHSHPTGPPHPSPTDIVEFVYPGVLTLIWFPGSEEVYEQTTDWTARAFRIEQEAVSEVPIRLINLEQPTG